MAFANVGQRVYTQALPNEGERRELDAVAEVKVKDPFAFHYGVGVQYQVGSFEFGANYSSAVRFDLKGTAAVELGNGVGSPLPGVQIEVVPVPDDQAQCARGGSTGALKTCLDLVIPQTLNAGVRWVARDPDGRERGDVELDVRWEDWSSAAEIEATIDGMDTVLRRPLGTSRIRNGLKDSYGIRLGGAKVLRPKNYDLVLRGGVGYDTESAPLTWTRISQDGAPKLTLNSGVGFDFSGWRVDFGVAYVIVPTRTVNDAPLPADADPADRVQPDVPAGGLAGSGTPYNPFNGGTYERSYFMGSLGVLVRF
jgi:long-subunit fatty acid transport protein